jgi:NADH-quinone oxidoreductase subunit N
MTNGPRYLRMHQRRSSPATTCIVDPTGHAGGRMNWYLLAPETILACFVLVILMADISKAKWKASVLSVTAIAGIVASAAFLWTQRDVDGFAAHGMYIFDAFAVSMKLLFLGITCVIILLTQEFLSRLQILRGEFYILILLACIGMMVLASAGDFLLLFIALELMTFSFYIMTAYLRSDHASVEAGLKYLILGAVASGCIVFGTSFVYGATGSTRFAVVQEYVAAYSMSPLLLIGALLVLCGLAFKLSAVPFHLWVPDVYQGAPPPVTAFLAAGSKAAGFVVLIRLVAVIFGHVMAESTVPVLALIAALTMCYGNLGAMVQHNVKRLLAYSSIGHAGYLLMGMATLSPEGMAAVVSYLCAYTLMTLVAFAVVICVSNATGSDDLEAYDGLSIQSPFLAAAMFIALLSLAGIPPFVGFFGKLWIMIVALRQGLFWLVAIGALNVVISLYYYLRVVKAMYTQEAIVSRTIAPGFSVRLVMFIALLCIVGLGVYQQPLVSFAIQATQGL